MVRGTRAPAPEKQAHKSIGLRPGRRDRRKPAYNLRAPAPPTDPAAEDWLSRTTCHAAHFTPGTCATVEDAREEIQEAVRHAEQDGACGGGGARTDGSGLGEEGCAASGGASTQGLARQAGGEVALAFPGGDVVSGAGCASGRR